MLVAIRTLAWHHVQHQIAKLPAEIRDQLVHDGKIESRLCRLERIDASVVSTIAGTYRLEWLVAFVDHHVSLLRGERRPQTSRYQESVPPCNPTTESV